MHFETDTLMHLEQHLNTPLILSDTGKITKGRTWVGPSPIPDGAAATCLPLYLSPRSSINSDSSSNASETSSPSSQSDTFDDMPAPPYSDCGCEKHFHATKTGAREVPLEASLKRIEQEANSQTVIDKRLLRSRKLSTLYQPAYSEYGSESSSSCPSCMSPFSTLFQDNSKELEESSPYISLEPTSSFQKIQRFRQSFHLPQLLPTFTFPPFLDSPSLWLALYFALNLWLTLYNKSVLIHFPFPYTLTALHALCGTVGASILLRLQGPDLSGSTSTGGTTQKASWSFFHRITPDLSLGESIVLLFFSMLYTINIVVSNASLRLVTVPFHQVVRASTPFFTIVFSLILLSKRCTKRKLLTLIPVVAGVCFATYGDYYFTTIGFFLTLLGTILAALKTILTNVILVKQPASPLPFSSDSTTHLLCDDVPNQSSPPPSFFSNILSISIFNSSTNSATNSPTSPTLSSFTLPKLSLSPLHLLYLLSPLAFIQTTLLAHFTGELSQVQLHLFHSSSSIHPEGASLNFRIWLVSNGILAFFLNVVSFNANRRVGPLAMSVAANVKQVLTILCAVILFDLTITPANGLGILLTLAGGALYAAVEYHEKQNGRRYR